MGKSRGCINCLKDKSRMYRYLALIMMCIVGLGAFICFDSVGSLQQAIMEQLNLSASQFSLMYSINLWPNILLCIFGGFLIDRVFGVQLTCIINACIFCCGHLIFSLGVVLGTYWVAIVGRFIFGAGMEMVFICLPCYLVLWFKGKELSTVICLLVSTSRLGTLISYQTAIPLYTAYRELLPATEAVGTVYFTVGIFPFLSIIFSVILKYMHPKRYNKSVETGKPKQNEESSSQKKIQFRDILRFPIKYWIVVIFTIAFSTSIFGFMPFSQGFFMSQFNLTAEAANNLTSFFSMISAILAPIIGLVADKVGRIICFAWAGTALIILTHLLLIFAPLTPYVAMAIISLALGCTCSSTIPMVSFLIPQHQMGTAFGIIQALISLVFAANLSICGILLDEYNYIIFEVYILSWSIFGLAAVSLLWFLDMRSNGILFANIKQRKLLENPDIQMDETTQPLKEKDPN